MRKLKCISFVIILFFWTVSCSKDEAVEDVEEQAEFLKFKIASKTNGTVLYSNWLKSQFPTSSLNNSEFFSLAHIQKEFFDADKDLMLVYGKRNTIFNLPVTIPASLESYSVELITSIPGVTMVRLRVSSLDLAALQNIFFRATAEAQFRVVIIPGEKLIDLNSKHSADFENMSYQELHDYFELPE